MSSPTSESNRHWIMNHPTKLERYVRRFHHRDDADTIINMVMQYPDEGRLLIENFDLTNEEKWERIFEFILSSPQITALFFADQRMGKDALVCWIIEECLKRSQNSIRVITLGNVRKPPFVDKQDMYFSYKFVPTAKTDNEVWIYSSEIEVMYPSREGSSAESRIYNTLEGTMAQNHQKLFGCVKLASKVDLNVIRSCNIKFFKYISQDKLNVEGIERDGILSGLGRLLIPSDRSDRTKVLVCFDNNIFSVSHPLPEWWTSDYSEMFNDISEDMIKQYVETQMTNGLKSEQISIMVAQKFRRNIDRKDVEALMGS